MQINKDYLCTNEKNTGDRGRNGTKSDYKYIVVHYTGALDTSREGNQQTAKNNCIYYRDATVGASANFYVDRGSEVFMSVNPLGARYAWHCGVGKSTAKYCIYTADGVECNNLTAIGVEICPCKLSSATRSASDPDWYFDEQTYKNAVEFVRYLMAEYNIPLSCVVRHYDVNTIHKLCPSPFVGNGLKTYYNKTGEQLWEQFKSDLQDVSPSPVAETYTADVCEVVSSDGYLNLRTAADVTAPIMQQMPTGSKVLALTSRADGWRKVDYIRGGYVFRGYCNGYYLKDIAPKEFRKVASPDKTLNIRTAPKDGRIIATMGNGLVFSVFDEAENGWSFVSCGQNSGYCCVLDNYSKTI